MAQTTPASTRTEELPAAVSSVELPTKMRFSASDVAETAFSLDTFSRFSYIWKHAQLLVSNSKEGGKNFDPELRAQSGKKPSDQEYSSRKVWAAFLAAAQDSLHAARPESTESDNIPLLKLLWSATTEVLDKSLDDCNLDLEAAAWGVIGLAAGYTAPSTSSALERQTFLEYKTRLKAALTSLPSLSSPHNSAHSGVSPHQRVFMLTKARREVHICSNMLVQQFRKEGWTGIRWYHGVAVAERWIENLK